MKTLIKINNRRYLNLREAIVSKLVSKRTMRSILVSCPDKVLKFGQTEFIDVDALSTQLKKKIETYSKTLQNQFEDNIDNVSEIELILTFAYTSGPVWRRNISRFTQIYLSEEQKIHLAKTYAFVDAVIGLHKEGYTLKSIFMAYCKLKGSIELSNFQCKSYNYFTDKIKHLETDGIEKGIINAKTGTLRLAKKVTKTHQKYLIKYYSNPARYKYKKIKELVNHEVIKLGLRPIGLPSVKMFLCQPEIQNTYKPFRLGRKWAQDTLYPYLVRLKPKRTNYQWQSDCTCLNFYVFDSNGMASRRWICIVIDVKSRKILAWKIGKYENIDLVTTTLLQAVRDYRVIPFEFVHDSSSAYKSQRFQEIESRMEEMGTYIRITLPENPKDKGCIESIWGILQADYFRNEKGYLGDGVRSFQEEGRVDPSVKSEYYSGKKAGIWTDVDLEEMVNTVVNKFNDKVL